MKHLGEQTEGKESFALKGKQALHDIKAFSEKKNH